MTAVRATFDGSRTILPPDASDYGPGSVIVIFEDVPDDDADLTRQMAAAQESAFAKVWDNDEDAVYDKL